MEELISIINELKAPKDKVNNFGKFAYRDAAGILEAVKPLLVKYGCLLQISTPIELIGDRYYVHAVVTIYKGEKYFSADAYAREQVTKSGMDEAQVTGAATSYAKKYALCNLFCIDDSKDDPDTDDATKKQKETGVTKQSSPIANKEDGEVAKHIQALLSFDKMDDVKKYISDNKINLKSPDYASVRVQLNNKFAQ